MIRSFLKNHRRTIASIAIPFIGAVVFKFFGADSPKSFTSIVKLVKGVLIEEMHQEIFQVLLGLVW